MRKSTAVAALVSATALGTAAAAFASAPPVGPLPKPAVTSVVTQRGSLVAVAVPRQPSKSGLVWRIARRFDSRVVREVSEADVDASVVVVFRAVGTGATTVTFALTRGDASGKAVRAVADRIRVLAS